MGSFVDEGFCKLTEGGYCNDPMITSRISCGAPPAWVANCSDPDQATTVDCIAPNTWTNLLPIQRQCFYHGGTWQAKIASTPEEIPVCLKVHYREDGLMTSIASKSVNINNSEYFTFKFPAEDGKERRIPIGMNGVGVHILGKCSNTDYKKKEECEAASGTWDDMKVCSDSTHTTKIACEGATPPAKWDYGFCSNPDDKTEGECKKSAGTWRSRKSCSNNLYDPESVCDAATAVPKPTWDYQNVCSDETYPEGQGHKINPVLFAPHKQIGILTW